MQFRLRTLMILMALGPPILAYSHWKYEHRPGWHLRQIGLALQNYHGDSYIPMPGTYRVRGQPWPPSRSAAPSQMSE